MRNVYDKNGKYLEMIQHDDVTFSTTRFIKRTTNAENNTVILTIKRKNMIFDKSSIFVYGIFNSVIATANIIFQIWNNSLNYEISVMPEKVMAENPISLVKGQIKTENGDSVVELEVHITQYSVFSFMSTDPFEWYITNK